MLVRIRKEQISMNVREARALFPALEKKIYLDSGAVGLMPAPATKAVKELVELASGVGDPEAKSLYSELVKKRLEAYPSLARLIGSSVDEIALVESTSHGLNLAAQSLPLRRGDRVIIPDSEFPQVAIPWVKLAETRGIKVTFFKSRKGRFTAEDIESAMDRRTKVVCLSSVQWSSGFRVELGSIGRLCRSRGVYLVVDAVQQIGAGRFDVRETPVDFLACGGHKWLNAPMGCGFLFIRRRLLRELRPPFYGYRSLSEPRGGWGRYYRTPTISPNRAYRFPAKARSFEIGGTANFPGAVALRHSVDLVNQIGIEAIEEHIQALVERLLAGLQALGIRIVSPLEREQRSGIVSFRVYRDPHRDWDLVRELSSRKIAVSMRYTSRVGGIRASIHYFNNENDIDRLVSALGEVGRGR